MGEGYFGGNAAIFASALVAGLILGGAVVWLILRGQIQVAAAKAKGDGEVERMELATMLRAKDERISELANSLERANAQLLESHAQLKAESEQRAIAQEKNARIPVLEANIADRDARIASLNGEITVLKTA